MKEKKGTPLLLFGTGGLAQEAYHLIRQISKANPEEAYEILGCVAEEESLVGVGTRGASGYGAGRDGRGNSGKKIEKRGLRE